MARFVLTTSGMRRYLLVTPMLLASCFGEIVPPDDAGPLDAEVTLDSGSHPDTGPGQDGGSQDGAPDAEPLDTGGLDDGGLDSGSLDAGASDATPADGAVDAGPPLVTLTVVLTGDGGGTITAAGTNLACPGACSLQVEAGSTITLVAQPDSSSTLDAWSVAACGQDPSCELVLNANAEVEVRFDLRRYSVTLTTSGDGRGQVTEANQGLACPGQCEVEVAHGTQIELRAQPDANNGFGGWSGDCQGLAATCALTVTAHVTANAAFDQNRATVSVSVVGTGGGTITSSDGVIDCPANACTASYAVGSSVTFTASPDATSTLVGWQGNAACTGTQPCTLFVGSAQNVAAQFNRITHPINVTVDPVSTGAGTVTSNPAGISCPPTCSADFVVGTQVVLTSTPDADSYHDAWAGACTTADADCTVTASQPQSVQVTWHQAPVQLTLGDAHTCARFADGSIKCWGLGTSGRLGHNTTTNVGDAPSRSVAQTPPVTVGWAATQVTAGAEHTCALSAQGAIRCWGSGEFGGLGHNSTNNVGDTVSRLIVAAGDLPFPSSQWVASYVDVGSGFGCRVIFGGLNCWGRADANGLGLSTNLGDGVGPDLSQSGLGIGFLTTRISAGLDHACALSFGTGTVRCWGNGADGRLGYGDTMSVGGSGEPRTHTTTDVPVGATVQAIVTGDAHTCALLTSGAVRCWGEGGGQVVIPQPGGQPSLLGYDFNGDVGSGTISIAQAGDVPVGGTAVELAAGSRHTCARLTTGAVRCWGPAGGGSLGYELSPFANLRLQWVGGAAFGLAYTRVSSILQVGDVPLPAPARHIAAGGNHTCAVLTNGDTYCWGENTYGQLGLSHTDDVATGTGPYPTIISAGKVHLF